MMSCVLVETAGGGYPMISMVMTESVPLLVWATSIHRSLPHNGVGNLDADVGRVGGNSTGQEIGVSFQICETRLAGAWHIRSACSGADAGAEHPQTHHVLWTSIFVSPDVMADEHFHGRTRYFPDKEDRDVLAVVLPSVSQPGQVTSAGVGHW